LALVATGIPVWLAVRRSRRIASAGRSSPEPAAH
jgi:hypothetical protein